MFLNVKTEYNFLKSLCKIDTIIKYTKENKYHQLAIVDDNYFIDTSKFIKNCEENDIKPILAVKKQVENSFVKEIIIYAKNSKGIKEINNMNIKIEDLNDLNSKNLILCFDIEKLNENNMNYIKDNFLNFFFSYNEKFLTNQEAYKLSLEDKKLIRSKMIFNMEASFVYKEDIDAFVVLNAIYNKRTYKEEKRNINLFQEKSMEYIIDKYNHIYEDIKENSKSFVNLIEKYDNSYTFEETLNFEKYIDVDFNDKLISLLKNYLEENNLMDRKKEYYLRLKYELETILNLKFQNYFLIMEEIVSFCNESDIYYGYGRGSAAGSLVSFLLKITKIDPIKYNLYFERFLNPQRSSMPDIDLDVSDVHRQEIIDHLEVKFGKKHVAKIFTINTYLAKSALNDVAKALEVDKNTIKKISSKLDSNLSFEDNIKNDYNFFSKYVINSQFDFLKDIVNKLEGLPKTTSIHAAGVIISAIDISSNSYINDGLVYSEAKYLEKSGFIKFDLLALSNLSFLQNMEKRIMEIDPNYNPKNISLEEKRVYNNLKEAKTFGIFQLESKGIKRLLKLYKPNTLMDLAILISLYRPGPMKNIDKYIKNKENFPNIKYPHEDLKSILEQTYGIMVFQEQIMEVVHKIASFSRTESDIFRVAMSKKNLEAMAIEEEKFINNGLKNSYSEPFLENLFSDIKEFAGYGFNKAHAISYARLIYQLMYVKSKYPTIFYSELYSSNINSPKKEEFLLELYSNNIEIISPTFLNLQLENTVSRGKINLGLYSIKNISKDKLELIYNLCKENLEFINDHVKFLTKTIIEADLSEIEIKSIVGSGFLDALNINRKSLIKTLISYNKDELIILRVNGEKIKIFKEDEYSFLENSKIEKEALAFNIKYSARDYLTAKFFKQHPNLKITPLTFGNEDLEVSKVYYIMATITALKEISTKNGDKMGFLSVKDQNKEIEITCFPSEYERYKNILKEVGSLNIFAIKRNKRDSLSLSEIIK